MHEPPRRRGFDIAVWLALVVTTLLAYLPAMRGGLLWDDDAHVTTPALQSLTGLYRIWFELGATYQYYPLLHTAFWLEHRLWGESVVGYHLVNALLHATDAFLAYVVLRKLQIRGHMFAAAIFALHPVHVESVAWISEQKNTLSALFYLGALRAHLSFDASREIKAYALALALFVLGLLTKTVTATLPAALLLIFWWQRGGLSWRRDALPLIPFFVLGSVAGVFTAWVERNLIGAEGAAFELSFAQRGLLAGRAIWFYLAKLVWPANLTFIYPRWDVDASVWWQWLFPLATAAMLFAFWRMRGRRRAPLTVALFFVGTLFPVLGFLNVYPFLFSFVADHFQYLASLGVIASLASGATLAAARLPRRARAAAPIAGAVLVGILATFTWRQSHMYSDVVTLYRTTIARNPTSFLVYNNLGALVADRGRQEEAMMLYRRALEIQPDYPEAHYNLGISLLKSGRAEESRQHFERALEANYPNADNNLGAALMALGRPRDAIPHYERVLARDRNSAAAHRNLGLALLAAGQTGLALQRFETHVQLEPNAADAHTSVANALLHSGQIEPGIEQYRRAIRLQPDHLDAHHNLGVALAQAGKITEAVEELRHALRIAPGHIDASIHLAKAYGVLGQRERAVATAEQAYQTAVAAGQQAGAQKIAAWLADYRSLIHRD